MAVVTLSGCMLPRSSSISCGPQAGLSGVAASQRGSSWKVNCKASNSPIKPSGHITMSLCCNSLHICSWWSWPWVSMPGAPSIIMLMCPLLNRGAWDRASFSQMKVYAKSTLSSTSSKSLWAASARVGYQACYKGKDPFISSSNAWHN